LPSLIHYAIIRAPWWNTRAQYISAFLSSSVAISLACTAVSRYKYQLIQQAQDVPGNEAHQPRHGFYDVPHLSRQSLNELVKKQLAILVFAQTYKAL